MRPSERLAAASAALVLLLMVAPGCGSEQASQGPEARPPAASVGPQKVRVASVELRDFEPRLSVTGTLMPHRRAELRALVDGTIESLPVDIGSRVRRGDLLFELRTVDFRIALEQAEAAVTRAEVMLRDREREKVRMEGLLREGSATEQARDQAQAAWEEAGAALREATARGDAARQALLDCTILAPYGGAITARHMERGEYAHKGDPVVEIMDLTTLNAEVEVPERYAGQVGRDLEVEVRVRSRQEPAPGKVVAVNPKVDVTNRTFTVKVAVDNAETGLQAGLFCSAEFVLDRRRAQPAVPADAVLRDEGRSTVWLVESGRVRAREILEAGSADGWVFVERGLRGGETVVTSGAGGLTEGAEVAVQ